MPSRSPREARRASFSPVALGQLVGQVDRDELRVVAGLEVVAPVFVATAQFVVVGQLPVVHYRDVGERVGPKRMGVVDVDAAFSGHAHVADAVGAANCANGVPLVHVDGRANVLDNLGGAADAVQGDAVSVQQRGSQLRNLTLVVDHQT